MKLYCLPTNFYLKKSVLLPMQHSIPIDKMSKMRWHGNTKRRIESGGFLGQRINSLIFGLENDFRKYCWQDEEIKRKLLCAH